MRKSLFLNAITVVALVTVGAVLQVYAQSTTSTNEKAAIEALEKRYSNAFNAKDVNGVMSCYAPGNSLFVFDVIPPREYAGWDAYKKDWEGLFSAYPGPVSMTISEQSITVVGNIAYGHHIESGHLTRKDGTRLNFAVRLTDVYRKMKGQWLVVQEHVSVPVDLETGKADLLSKP